MTCTMNWKIMSWRCLSESSVRINASENNKHTQNVETNIKILELQRCRCSDFDEKSKSVYIKRESANRVPGSQAFMSKLQVRMHVYRCPNAEHQNYI